MTFVQSSVPSTAYLEFRGCSFKIKVIFFKRQYHVVPPAARGFQDFLGYIIIYARVYTYSTSLNVCACVCNPRETVNFYAKLSISIHTHTSPFFILFSPRLYTLRLNMYHEFKRRRDAALMRCGKSTPSITATNRDRSSIYACICDVILL